MLSLKSEKGKELFCLLICCVVAVVFCLIISEDTSPLYDRAGGDSAMYYVIGRGWTQGVLPYSGLFDQKGPIIYLINACGYLLAHSIRGVFCIQCLFMTFTVYVSYRFLSLKWGGYVKNVFLAIFLFSLIISYGGGNNVEEYLLPFLLLSFYGIYKYFIRAEDGLQSHPLKYALLYGFTVAFCYLTRLTNALGLCAAILFISINLGIHHKWKNLWANILVCFIGFAVPVGISFLYFYSKGTFSQMWWATMTFNFNYLGNSGFQFTRGLKDYLFFFIPMLNMFAIFCLSTYALFKQRHKIVPLCWIFSVLATFSWIIYGNGFSHYCMVALPFYFITVLDFHPYRKSILGKSLFVVFLSITVLAGAYRGVRIIVNDKGHEVLMDLRADIKAIEKLTTKKKLASLCVFSSFDEFYVQSGITPAFTFFSHQNFHAQYSPDYQYHIRDAFCKSNLSCIIVNNGIDDSVLYDMIKSRFKLSTTYKGHFGIYYIYTK